MCEEGDDINGNAVPLLLRRAFSSVQYCLYLLEGLPCSLCTVEYLAALGLSVPVDFAFV